MTLVYLLRTPGSSNKQRRSLCCIFEANRSELVFASQWKWLKWKGVVLKPKLTRESNIRRPRSTFCPWAFDLQEASIIHLPFFGSLTLEWSGQKGCPVSDQPARHQVHSGAYLLSHLWVSNVLLQMPTKWAPCDFGPEPLSALMWKG